jgi:hypothetical protein
MKKGFSLDKSSLGVALAVAARIGKVGERNEGVDRSKDEVLVGAGGGGPAESHDLTCAVCGKLPTPENPALQAAWEANQTIIHERCYRIQRSILATQELIDQFSAMSATVAKAGAAALTLNQHLWDLADKEKQG